MIRETKKILFAGILITLIICSLIVWILSSDFESYSKDGVITLQAATTNYKKNSNTDSLKLKANQNNDSLQTHKKILKNHPKPFQNF
jgi:hypothetical protein